MCLGTELCWFGVSEGALALHRCSSRSSAAFPAGVVHPGGFAVFLTFWGMSWKCSSPELCLLSSSFACVVPLAQFNCRFSH